MKMSIASVKDQGWKAIDIAALKAIPFDIAAWLLCLSAVDNMGKTFELSDAPDSQIAGKYTDFTTPCRQAPARGERRCTAWSDEAAKMNDDIQRRLSIRKGSQL